MNSISASPRLPSQRCGRHHTAPASAACCAPLRAAATPPPRGPLVARPPHCTRVSRRMLRGHLCRAEAGGPEGPGESPPPPQQQPAQAAASTQQAQQAQQAQQQQQQQAPMDPDVWSHKPAWCQPWSILATGTAIVSGVWAISGHSPGWTAFVALPVGAWWGLFLVLYPAQFREYVEGQREEQLRQGRRE